MADILIIGESNSFLIAHLSYWLKLNKIDFIISGSLKQFENQHFRLVLFMSEVTEDLDYTPYSIQEPLFFSSLQLVRQALLLNYDHFVYVDLSHQTDIVNLTYKTCIDIERLMVTNFCSFLQKKCSVIYLYDIIGRTVEQTQRRFHNVGEILSDKFFSKSNTLNYSFYYQNKHLVYINDAMRALVKIISSPDIGQEEHIRYDDVGFNVENIIPLFEKVNKIEFANKNIIIGKEKAPILGAPSLFLKEFKSDERLWFKVRR